MLPGAGIANVRRPGRQGRCRPRQLDLDGRRDGRRKPFNKPHTNVCNVATLYPQYFQFVVLADAGINKIADLKGKSVTTQQVGNTGEEITRHFLEAGGVKMSDVRVSHVGYTDSVNLMKDGKAVAFGLNTQAPAGAIMDLMAARKVKFFEQTDVYNAMLKLNPATRSSRCRRAPIRARTRTCM